MLEIKNLFCRLKGIFTCKKYFPFTFLRNNKLIHENLKNNHNPLFSNYGGTIIGFCTKNFSLESKWLGCEANTIGFWRKDRITINGSSTNFGNDFEFFKKGDIVGIGLVYQPNSMKCFATCNGKLLGKIIENYKIKNI